MELVHIFFTALGSIIALFFLTKLLGNKQMSQLSMFDYINGITIGSIAAEMATALEDDFLKPLIAMIVYAGLAFSISYLTCKSITLRRFLTGRSVILIEDGKIYNKNLLKAKLDIDEMLTQCRNDGYFNISDIQSAILETNGKISILPKSDKRPINPTDLGLQPKEEKPVVNIIMDGRILEGNLKFTGNNEKWLEKQLKSQGMENVKDIFLATCDFENNVSVYVKIDKVTKRDIFS